MSQPIEPSHQFTALAPHYDELMQVVPYEAWAEYVMLLCSMVEHTPHKVLDCACGTGNVSFELSKMGLEVVGVDIAPAMINVAQEKLAKSQVRARFHQADLTTFNLNEEFDTATCLYDSLNYFLEADALGAAFQHIANHVKTAGWFIFDMNTPYALTQDLFTQRSIDPRKALHYDWHARHDSASGITSVEMLFTRQEANGKLTHFSEVHQERAYSLATVQNLLEQSGWRMERIYDAYTLNWPHESCERWFFVAQRL